MGVRGLQTFLKENRQSLCRSILLDRNGAATRPATPVVVDAWGIIYQLYLESLPWTSGGEYYRFYCLTRRLIKAWRSVGLEPTFVFDGASPPEKHATLLERLQNQVATARMFYTISAQTRSAPSFSKSNAVLPPFTAHAFGRALADLQVVTHYVPAGEADGMCVVMAAEMGGYVIGRDTDFIILASGASDAMKGYVPLDMIEWVDTSPMEEDFSEGGSFRTVKGGKKTSARISRLLPSKRCRNPTLVFATYTSAALCRRLRLPANLMPLFSSLVGNDYTPTSSNELFFPNGSKPAERIERIARTLREQQHARSSTTNHGDAAADLVRRVVRKLYSRPYIDERLMNEVVDAVIEATIQYVLPSRSQCCSLYPFCGDETCPSVSRIATPAASPPPGSQALKAYADAQRHGHLNLVTHSWLYPDRVYLWSVLEEPSGPCARAGHLAIAARTAAYLIVEEGLDGLRFPAAGLDPLEELQQDLAVCKLLGVENGEASDNDSNASSKESDSAEGALPSAEPPRTITEHVRQGSSNRIVARSIELPPKLDNPTPTCLLPLEDRRTAYLTHMDAHTPTIAALPAKLHPLVAVVRLCIAQAAEADTTGTRRWRKPEVEAVLRAGIGCLEGGWSTIAADAEAEAEADDSQDLDLDLDLEPESEEQETDYPHLSNRNAELVAQLASGFQDAQLLAQSLLLTEGTHLAPYLFFSGIALHSLLSGTEPGAGCGWRWSAAYKHKYHDALAAILASVPESAVASGAPVAKTKKDKKKAARVAKSSTSTSSSGSGAFGSRFDLLIGADM